MYTISMIFNGLEKLSLVDFDGVVACTLFTSGCNFRCGFCHNSPLVLGDNLPQYTEQEILEFLVKRNGIIEGVCISGGEPTLNHDLAVFIKKVKELGLKVKLDTNGTNPKMLKSLIEQNLLDYVAMDIKADKQNYSKIIEINNFDLTPVEESVNILLNGSIDYEFRTTLIKQIHTEKVINNIAKWIGGAKKYCLQKYVYRDTCFSCEFTEVDLETAKKFKDILQNHIKNTQLRGY